MVLKLICFKKFYFLSKWNVFDFIVIILSFADSVLTIIYLYFKSKIKLLKKLFK